MPITEIAFVVYPVADMPRAMAFYADVLGLRTEDRGAERWAEFDVAGQTFAITTVEMAHRPGAGNGLALEVDDLQAFRQALAAQGVPSPQEFESPVCWMAPIEDPDGNSLLLHQRKPGGCP